MSEVTRIIEAVQHADPKDTDQLLALGYGPLRKLAAASQLREAWLKIAGDGNHTSLVTNRIRS